MTERSKCLKGNPVEWRWRHRKSREEKLRQVIMTLYDYDITWYIIWSYYNYSVRTYLTFTPVTLRRCVDPKPAAAVNIKGSYAELTELQPTLQFGWLLIKAMIITSSIIKVFLVSKSFKSIVSLIRLLSSGLCIELKLDSLTVTPSHSGSSVCSCLLIKFFPLCWKKINRVNIVCVSLKRHQDGNTAAAATDRAA